MASNVTSKREGKGAVQSAASVAHAALLAGDFQLAHTMAKRVADDAAASDADKAESREILDATSVAWDPLIAGFTVLGILLCLFAWVLIHGHTS
jgi:hypothetical protein